MNGQIGTTRVTTRVLMLLFLTVLALGVGVFNLRDRLGQKAVPTDGVLWKDNAKLGVVAENIEAGGPAVLADIRKGDVLIGISTTGKEPYDEITEAQQVQVYLDIAKENIRHGIPTTLSYWVDRRNDAGDTSIRDGVADVDIVMRESHPYRYTYLAIIGLAFLGIGLFFLLRQGRAPYVVHFYLICLLSFIVYFFSSTDEMRMQFDKVVDFADFAALILLAPVMVHFAAIYPSRYHWFTQKRWKAVYLYIPSILLLLGELVVRISALSHLLSASRVNLRIFLSKIELAMFGISMIVSAVLFIRNFRRSKSIVVRQQLKWVMWGMGLAGIIFSLFYIPLYWARGSVASGLEILAITPLILIPLTLGYSIVRYRLTDVDTVMRRSLTYVVSTLSVAGIFGSVMALSYEIMRKQLSEFATLLVTAVSMSVIAMLFAPVKNWIQERIDRKFYGEKYDYRITLQDFGRTLASTTALEPMFDSLVRRLKEVFSIEKIAVFVEDRKNGVPSTGFRIARLEGLNGNYEFPTDKIKQILDDNTGEILIADDEYEEYQYVVPQQVLAASGGPFMGHAVNAFRRVNVFDSIIPHIAEQSNNRTINYYIPCAARSRVVAVIGLGRTTDGALLSSEDLKLLRAVSGYVAIAIENSLLLEEQGQKANELALQKEYTENIVESISVGVMVVNLHGRITNWNGALEGIYGLNRDQAIGNRLTEVFHHDLLRIMKYYMDGLEWSKGTPLNIYKIRAKSFDGRDLILNISLAEFRNSMDQADGTLIAIEDVTERIRLEEQLQQSDKLTSIGLLAAGVAHEVNTPLTGISSYAQMLMQQMAENDPRRIILDKIHRQAMRASAIVNNLLNFSRTADSQYFDVDVNRVIEDTIQLLDAQMRNTRIEVIRHYTEDLPMAYGNAAKLQQVFMNMILNAKDAMPGGGSLDISTESDENTVTVIFKDTGIGIDPDHLSKIFDPFFTTKQIGKGTGLGLAVSYGIIQDHGGRINVTSMPGEGTEFHITLPPSSIRTQLAAAGD